MVVYISIMTMVQWFLWQAWKEDTSWLLAGETSFERRAAFICAGMVPLPPSTK